MANGQIIIRRAKAKDTRIQNRIIWDKSISQMARFSLIAMLSLPDTWDYSVRGMAVMLQVSKDTMSKYLNELETAGYLKRRQSKEDTGRFSSAQYILTDTPGDFGEEEPCPNIYDTDSEAASPCPSFSDPKIPDPKKSPQKKRNIENKKNTTEGLEPPKAPQGGRVRTSPSYQPDWFEQFWNLYPRKTNRIAAVRAWDKLKPDFELCKTIGQALRAQCRMPQWANPQHIPHPSTWLNGARWMDKIIPSAPSTGREGGEQDGRTSAAEGPGAGKRYTGVVYL